MYGITANGFIRKTFNDILDSMLTKAKTIWGDDFASNQSSVAYMDMVNRAEELAELWELAEQVYYSLFPHTASGLNLTYNCSLVGVNRIKARKSIVRGVELTNNNSTNPITIPAGAIVEQSGSKIQWELLNNVVIPANGSATGDFRCLIEGPIYAPIGTIDTIITQIPNWSAVSNPNDVLIQDLGRLEESDSELKIRREIAIRNPSSATSIAIVNKLLQEVPNCIYANYRENDSNITDANGLPPHSIEFFVLGGASIDIANTIFKYKPAGIITHGNNSYVVSDSLNNNYEIKWSSLVQKDIYFRIEITTNSQWNIQYKTDIENLIIDYVNNKHPFGTTLYNWKYYTFLDNFVGINTIKIYQAFIPNPTTESNLTCASNEKAYTTPSNFTWNIT